MSKSCRKTIKDVAAAAGVSIGTASRALNRRGRVSEATISRVTNAASKLGYQPDAIAQSLRRKSTMVVGMLVTDLSNPFFAGVIRAAERRLQQAGYALLIGNTDNDARREQQLIDLFRRRRVDGLILGPCEAENTDLIARLDAGDLPVVAYDRNFDEGLSGLQVAHRKAAYDATRHLLNLGHERIALLSSSVKLSPGYERIAGYRRALEDRGIPFRDELVRAHQSSMEFVTSEAFSLMSIRPAPTAFLTLGTRMLAATLEGLRENGWRVPKDVSVLTIGDTDLARLYVPPISTMTWDLTSVGENLAELMLRRLDPDTEKEPRRIMIPMKLVERGSCGRPGHLFDR